MTEAVDLRLRLAEPADAPEWLDVIRDAFSARRPVDPPADALADTVEDIVRVLSAGYGVGVDVDGELAGCLLLVPGESSVTLRRVSVRPRHSRHGIAGIMVRAALDFAADLGATRAELVARAEFPELVNWWRGHGFEVVDRDGHELLMARDVPRLITIPTADDMQQFGRNLAGLLRAGDVLILSGELGAGKTTLAQGIGEGLGVAGPIISPTFVISRVHEATGDGPRLVHVDAYRLGDGAELADIDLDASLPTSVTLVEWGAGKAEWLSRDRLEIRIERDSDPASDERSVILDGIGARWSGVLNAWEAR